MTQTPPAASHAAPTPLRIFLLDDNAIDREICRRHLARVGAAAAYEFVEHNAIEGALERVRTCDPHCILLDYHLHDGTGLQFLEALRAIGGPRRYPVVMLTGTGSEKIAVDVMKIGAQDYLSKESLTSELLYRAIESAIYRARTERLLEEQRVEMERLFVEAKNANARKDQFLANLSHELRTPLTPVLAAVSQSQFANVTAAEFIEMFAMIRRNIEVEARLIDDMLDLTRISSGKLQIHTRAIDLHEVLRHAAEACESDCERKSIQLRWELAPESIPLQADAGRIQQIFWNLLKNAVKFTPTGGEITVTTRKRTDIVEIEVADTGIGLRPGDDEKIFDAFEQGSSEVTKKFGGLGLGLAISKALVAAHGGRISAANRASGRGAVFTVCLPLEVEPQAISPAAPPAGPAAKSDSPGTTILLAEDHPDSAHMLRRVLVSRGYQVHLANTARDALDLFKTHHIDCLVSDLGLPDASGLDLITQISQMRSIPAIALSGYGMESDIQRSLAAGFRQHIIKPVDVQQLLLALETLLKPAAAR